MSDWNNKLKEFFFSHIREIKARGVQLDLWLDPPTQPVWADLTLVTVGSESPSPTTKTDGSVGGTTYESLIFNWPDCLYTKMLSFSIDTSRSLAFFVRFVEN